MLLTCESAAEQAQHHAVSAETPWHDAVCNYELRDPPRCRLRRWPRRASLETTAVRNPAKQLWPVLDPPHWLWDE